MGVYSVKQGDRWKNVLSSGKWSWTTMRPSMTSVRRSSNWPRFASRTPGTSSCLRGSGSAVGAADGYEDDYRDQPAEDPDSQVPVRLQAQAQADLRKKLPRRACD